MKIIGNNKPIYLTFIHIIAYLQWNIFHFLVDINVLT